MEIVNEILIDESNINGDTTGDCIDISRVHCFSVQIIKTGSGMGKLHLEKSNDSANWVNCQTVVITPGTMNEMVSQEQATCKFFRFKYEHGADPVNLKLIFNGKH